MRKGKCRQTDQEPWQEWSIQNEMGWEEGCILLGITAGNALCLSLNRPGQGGLFEVKEQVGHRLVTTLQMAPGDKTVGSRPLYSVS